MKPTIKVYSKECLECHDEKWRETRNKLMAEYAVKEYRTALNPLWHHIAKKLAGTDDYKPFILYPDGTIKAVREVEDESKENEATDKRRVQKRSQVQKMRGRTTTKSARVARVARPKSKAKKKVEEVK